MLSDSVHVRWCVVNAAIASPLRTHVQCTSPTVLMEFASPAGLRSGTILKVDFWNVNRTLLPMQSLAYQSGSTTTWLVLFGGFYA